MKRFFMCLLILLVACSAWAESVETWTNPSTNIKKTVIRTVDTANTVEAVVRRDSSGNFAAGTITATLSGLALQGGASVAATSGAVAIPVTNLYSGYTTNSTAAITATLADGTAGQVKIIKLETKDTNNMVVTPSNLADGSTITFDATGEVAVLVFDGTNWQVVYTNATVA